MSNLILHLLSYIFTASCVVSYLYFHICLYPSSFICLYLTLCLSILYSYVAYWPFGIIYFLQITMANIWHLCIHCIQVFDDDIHTKRSKFFFFRLFPQFYFKSNFSFFSFQPLPCRISF